MLLYAGTFTVALMVVLCLTPLVRRFAIHANIIDKPNKRKIHHTPIPRLGGLGIYLAFAAAVCCFVPLTHEVQGMMLGGTLIMILGIIDDWRELPAKVKLCGQILCASVLLFYGIDINFVTNPFGDGMIHLGQWGKLLTIFWVVGVTNTLNLIDGLDGLAAGVSAIASITLLVVALSHGQLVIVLLTAALAGSTLGFLKYNFNPARIFMGDTGSMFLGYMLAVIAVDGTLKSATTIALLVPLLALGLPIMDTTFAILRRLVHGNSIFQADKGHLHHRLLAAGLSQKQAVLILYLISAGLGISAIALTQMKLIYGETILGIILISMAWGMHKLTFINNEHGFTPEEKKVEN